MTGAELQNNRRRSYRAEVHGCAIVHSADGTARRCVVVDLSLGGVRLIELLPDQPVLGAERDVVVELECSGAGWVAQRGRVIRHEKGELAVRFLALKPDVEDLIEDEVLGALEAERVPRVVVVDLDAARRGNIAAALRAAGCCPLEAGTPLEAVDVIERSRNHVSAAVLAEHLTQTQADDFEKYLRAQHPEVRIAPVRELICGDRVNADQIRELGESLRAAKLFK